MLLGARRRSFKEPLGALRGSLCFIRALRDSLNSSHWLSEAPSLGALTVSFKGCAKVLAQSPLKTS